MNSTVESPLHVLVVDDHEDSCELLKVVLEQRGHRVTIAHDGERAMVLLREQSFDVALIDLGLPIADGFEVARAARELGDETPYLVAVTGHGSSDYVEATKRAGFDLHLLKPIDFGMVANIVTEARPSRAR
jgi:CheY-like chemotaxis protein